MFQVILSPTQRRTENYNIPTYLNIPTGYLSIKQRLKNKHCCVVESLLCNLQRLWNRFGQALTCLLTCVSIAYFSRCFVTFHLQNTPEALLRPSGAIVSKFVLSVLPRAECFVATLGSVCCEGQSAAMLGDVSHWLNVIGGFMELRNKRCIAVCRGRLA